MNRRGGIAVLWCAIAVAAIAASCARAGDVVTPTCAAGELACGPICVNAATDSDNCSTCGNVCALGQACIGGTCTAVCPKGDDVVCGGDGGKSTCVNTQSDNANCGSCGKTCPFGQFCHAGSCGSNCSTSETKCTPDAGVPFCTNTKTDNANCGACGKSCGLEEVCTGGVCVSACDTTQTLCTSDAGPTGYCANLSSDNANCGTCGTTCSGTFQFCSDGGCTSQCTPSQTLCPGGGTPFCADTLTDNVNCGTCGNVCPTAKPLCNGGKCTNASAPAGCVVTSSPGVYICISNSLVSTYSTAAHCAACTEKGLTNACVDNSSCSSLFTNSIVQTLYNYRTGLTCTAQTDQTGGCGWGEIMTPTYQVAGNCPTPQDCTTVNWASCTYGVGSYSAYIYGVCK